MSRRWSTTLRWGACFAVAIGLHAAGAAALIVRWNDNPDRVASAPVIMIDLAPVAVAPQTTPTEVPPDQVARQQQIVPDPVPEKPPEITEVEPEPKKPVEQVEIEPEPEPEKPVEKVEVEPEPVPEPEKPIEKVEIEPAPAPEPELAMLPPPKPPIEKKIEKPVEKKKKVRKKPRRRHNSLASAPSTADRKATHAAAPMAGASARDHNALPNWTSRLIARLERYKRYPSQAQSRGDYGVVRLAFSVDRSGGVHGARILRSSGSPVLDRETLSMIARASPLPPPPPTVRGSQIAVVVPIRYNIR